MVWLVFIQRSSAARSRPSPITFAGGKLQVPTIRIIPYIEGDGTGRDIWSASVPSLWRGEKAYAQRKITVSIFAAKMRLPDSKDWLSRRLQVTPRGPACLDHRSATTPSGGGIRS